MLIPLLNIHNEAKEFNGTVVCQLSKLVFKKKCQSFLMAASVKYTLFLLLVYAAIKYSEHGISGYSLIPANLFEFCEP